MLAPGVVIYTDLARYEELLQAGLFPKEAIALKQYEVQLLGIDFILPTSRAHAVEQRYLLRY